MASLVEQIFMQAQAGSANGASLIEPFAQGMQFGQRQQQIDLQKQQVAAELAQLPLKQTLLRQDAEMNALKIKDFLEQRQFAIEDEKTVSTAWDWAGKEMEKGNLLGALDVWHDFASASQRLLQNEKFMFLRKELTDRLELETERQKIKQSHGQTYTPGFGQAINPDTGKPATYWRSGVGSAQLMDDTATPKPQSTLGKMFADRDAAIAAGRIDEAKALDKQIELDQAAASTYAGLTPANQTRVQQGLSDSLSTIDIANRLEPLIDTETVGARSFVETWVKDRVLAQAFPEMASNKRASAESLAAQLRASAVRELKTDSNITEKERNQILQSIPDINAPIDSPARAKQLIGDIRKMSAIRAVVSAFKLGQPMPKTAAQVLTNDELVRLKDTGVITAEQALQIFDARQ